MVGYGRGLPIREHGDRPEAQALAISGEERHLVDEKDVDRDGRAMM